MSDRARLPPLTPTARNWALLTTALALLPLLLQLPGMLAAVFATTALLVALLAWRRPVPLPLRLLLVATMLVAIYWQMGASPGRDTGCALLAAMLAIKSSELRTLRDARSLLGFALFAPFAAFLLDQGPGTLLLSLAAVACALLGLQHLADTETGAAPQTAALQLRTVGRLLAVALPLALSAFWLLPRLPTPLWGIPERAIGKPGLSDTMAPGQWLDLMADDSPALRAQFAGAAPPPEQRYWRGPVLTRFDGRIWTRLESQRRRPPPAMTAGPAQWDYQIEYEATERRELVALDLPLAAPDQTGLDADYTLVSARPLATLTRWRLRSAPPARFQPALPPDLREAALQLPRGFNPRTLALARQWRRDAGNDDAAIVRRAMQWISRDFSYTLSTPLPGRHGADEFLFDWKAGFCEHFSSAFVVLMRGAGIPARVVTGYAGGTRNRYGDYWLVRRMDAHAWAEVWLPQRGWTASTRPRRSPRNGSATPSKTAWHGATPPGADWTWARAGCSSRRPATGCAATGTAWSCPSMHAASNDCSVRSASSAWNRRNWSGCWPPSHSSPSSPWPGCWRVASASVIRCCAPGAGSTAATPASASAGRRTKPPATGPRAWTPSGPAAGWYCSASVSAMRATLAPRRTSLHYCVTCTGTVLNPEHPPEHEHEDPHPPCPRRQPDAGRLCHRPQAAAATVQHGVPA